MSPCLVYTCLRLFPLLRSAACSVSPDIATLCFSYFLCHMVFTSLCCMNLDGLRFIDLLFILSVRHCLSVIGHSPFPLMVNVRVFFYCAFGPLISLPQCHRSWSVPLIGECMCFCCAFVPPILCCQYWYEIPLRLVCKLCSFIFRNA